MGRKPDQVGMVDLVFVCFRQPVTVNHQFDAAQGLGTIAVFNAVDPGKKRVLVRLDGLDGKPLRPLDASSGP
jgi:hypothetical protein